MAIGHAVLVPPVLRFYNLFTHLDSRPLFVGPALYADMIRFGLEHGCEFLDLGGVKDPRYPSGQEGWDGFTMFKLEFRPLLLANPPSFVLVR